MKPHPPLRSQRLRALVYQQVPATVPAGTGCQQPLQSTRGYLCTGGAPPLPRAALSGPFLNSFRSPCAGNSYMRDVVPLLLSPVLQCSMCVYVWVLGCLLVLTLCLLTFNLDSSIDILPTGGCNNFLDVRYYAARQLSAISKSLNLTIICRAYTKKAFV